MGYVKVKALLRNPYLPERSKDVELLADTGGIYTVVLSQELEELKIKPKGKRKFKLADGSIIERDTGIVEIELNGDIAHSTVVFGEKNDSQILGLTTLEELGLQVDPISGQLKPLELLLL